MSHIIAISILLLYLAFLFLVIAVSMCKQWIVGRCYTDWDVPIPMALPMALGAFILFLVLLIYYLQTSLPEIRELMLGL